jgi:HlyD family secretion protein
VAQFWVDVDVDEVDVAQLQPGQEALIQIDALPNTSLKGKVDQIAVTSKLVNGVVSYAVRVVLDGRQAPLKPGMTATTRIVLSQKKNVLRVPNEAIRRDLQTGRAFISVSATELNDDGSDDTTGKATDPTTHEVEVTLGLQDTDYTEIVSGAQEGQVVLINSGK